MDGYVAYAVAAVVVVQALGDSASQTHFALHDDDVTCLTVEKGGAVRRAASGQVQSTGGESCCVYVWTLQSKVSDGRRTGEKITQACMDQLTQPLFTQKLLYKCGLGFFQRQVQAVSFGGEREKGGQSKYLVAVGGDNNQTMGVFDLKAAAVLLAEREDDNTINAPILAFFGMDKLPGALPTVYSLQWVGNGGNFVSLSQGKSLKFWEMVEGGQNDAGTPNTITQKVRGGQEEKIGIALSRGL